MRRPPLAVAAAMCAAALTLACTSNDDGSDAPTPTIGEPTEAASPTNAADGTASPDATATSAAEDGLVTLQVEGENASAEVHVELALTSEEITTGLMHRESLAEDRGMLFVFEEPSHTGFWMRNTLIPLDIAYMAEDGRIREIKRGEPLDETLLRPELPYSFVLEVNAGWFERHGLGAGDRVIIPDLSEKS